MDCDRIVFSGHALQRMFDRQIGPSDVEFVLRTGEVIADYPDDLPYPSCLTLGFVDGRPIHVVAALEAGTGTCFVITVYPPDPEYWDEDYKCRRL